jgi:hypothetical protein
MLEVPYICWALAEPAPRRYEASNEVGDAADGVEVLSTSGGTGNCATTADKICESNSSASFSDVVGPTTCNRGRVELGPARGKRFE